MAASTEVNKPLVILVLFFAYSPGLAVLADLIVPEASGRVQINESGDICDPGVEAADIVTSAMLDATSAVRLPVGQHMVDQWYYTDGYLVMSTSSSSPSCEDWDCDVSCHPYCINPRDHNVTRPHN